MRPCSRGRCSISTTTICSRCATAAPGACGARCASARRSARTGARRSTSCAPCCARSDQTPPFEFFADILGRRRGRERLIARLGHEAADPIDEFLALTLTYERQSAPTLQGFLAWFEAGAAEIKRDMEQGRNEARVMTVHGAKGLEANIVFLPDTCSAPDGRTDPRLLWTDERRAAAALADPRRQ